LLSLPGKAIGDITWSDPAIERGRHDPLILSPGFAGMRGDVLRAPVSRERGFQYTTRSRLSNAAGVAAMQRRVRNREQESLYRATDNESNKGSSMIVGFCRETFPGENRVAMAPAAIQPAAKSGIEYVMETGAGGHAGYPDAEYQSKGVRIVSDRAEVFRSADVVIQVRCVGANPATGRVDLELMRRGQVIIGHCDPLSAGEACREIAERGATLFAMELIPRTTRAQAMDVLSSQATIAGYKAVLLAADALPRIFPMLTTAAGTIKPARVLIIGAGVAGLQAIATARRLGAMVSAYDVRPAVKEQIESLGAKFIVLGFEAAGSEDKGGYAKAMDEDFYRRQREAMAAVIKEQDAVITTAAIPGKKAPILVTRDMVVAMAPGSVVVDLAAERGGNCDATEPGRNVQVGGATVMGPLNLPSTVPYHASVMYARNVANFLKLLVKDGAFHLNLEDDIVKGTLVAHDGQVVHPQVAGATPVLAPA